MRFGICVLSVLAIVGSALPVQAAWLCVGTSLPFQMTLDGARARFDYLGDGRFGVDPPVPRDIGPSSLHDLVTRRSRLAFLLVPQDCAALRATLPVRIDIAIPRNGEVVIHRGCCLWRDLRPDP
jgi:hypothetical protein